MAARLALHVPPAPTLKSLPEGVSDVLKAMAVLETLCTVTVAVALVVIPTAPKFTEDGVR